MLALLAHRGRAGAQVRSSSQATLGAVWSHTDPGASSHAVDHLAVWDAPTKLLPTPEALAQEPGPFALAIETPEGVFLARDLFGVRPLYYGYDRDGQMGFASEVKALLPFTREVHEFPAGSWYLPAAGFQPFAAIQAGELVTDPAAKVADDLRLKLEQAVYRRIDSGVMGSWLSGGLDSSVIAALARPYLKTLHTFAGGLPGATDLQFARQMAADLRSDHHEILLTEQDLLAALPQVIRALESFDALLVRSTIVNYLVAQEAANWVGEVFSGEGGDELFAGYAYLDDLADEAIPAELLDITRRLHNTALQRVDRSAHAHGIVPYVPFLDTEAAAYVMRLPAELKRGPAEERSEKWILRKALEGRVPEAILWRKKAKFWEGAGVSEILSQHAEVEISGRDFQAERRLPNGWRLNTKEELLYYRLFKDAFGELTELDWMGRTKGAPGAELELVALNADGRDA
jgi:asparagine synthase (glutamine-hydrolysing)